MLMRVVRKTDDIYPPANVKAGTKGTIVVLATRLEVRTDAGPRYVYLSLQALLECWECEK